MQSIAYASSELHDEKMCRRAVSRSRGKYASAKTFYGGLFDWTFTPLQGTDMAVDIVSRDLPIEKPAMETPMTKPDISSIAPFFIVHDIAAALSFYRDRLGQLVHSGRQALKVGLFIRSRTAQPS